MLLWASKSIEGRSCIFGSQCVLINHVHLRILGHLARSNPQWQAFTSSSLSVTSSSSVLVIFKPPASDAYISPSWYLETKPTTHLTVPTWDYIACHCWGTLRVVDCEKDAQNYDELKEILEKLVTKHEEGRPVPWKMEDAPRYLWCSCCVA